MQQTEEITLKLPDLDALTPFPWSGCNPHYEFSDRTSTKWMLNYGVLSDFRASRLDITHIELLGAYAYPYADLKGLRIANDLVTIITTIDEVSDEQDEEGIKAARDTFVKALTGNARDDTSPIAMFAKDFIDRLSCAAPEELRNRIVTNFIEYAGSLTREVSFRADGIVPSYEEFLSVRRLNGAISTCFDTMEILMGFVLPEEVREDENFKNTAIATIDLINLSNDICSYTAEYARGLDWMNVVTILMKGEGLSHQKAMDRAAEIYMKRIDDMLAHKKAIPSFGPEVDKMVSSYVYGLEQWVYANNVWNLDTRRYFGDEHEEVKRTKIAKLRRRGSAP